MRDGHQKCQNTPNSQGNEFWPETGKYFKAMGSQGCSSHSAILRWKIHLNLSNRWRKIIALGNFEESSGHASTASGFPDFGFNSGEAQSQMWGSASPRPPSCSRDLTAESSSWIQAPAPCVWGTETEPGALPLFRGRCWHQELQPGHAWRQEPEEAAGEEHPQGSSRATHGPKPFPFLGMGAHTSLEPAAREGGLRSWSGVKEPSEMFTEALGPHCPGPTCNVGLWSCSFTFTSHLWIFNLTRGLGSQERCWSRYHGEFRKTPPALDPHWALGCSDQVHVQRHGKLWNK